MTGAPAVVLDACVLANFSLCDTLLRLAEPPPLYEPKWSQDIIRETTRTFESKLRSPASLMAYFESELRAHFSDAWISDYEPLMNQMANDEKDRHVLAAAVHGKASIIVTLKANPYFFAGSAAEGIGGPHEGLDMIWPMSIMMKALTSGNDDEIRQCLTWLKNTDAGTGFMHESFHKDDAKHFTRPWFAWANTLFGELILKVHEERPGLLEQA